MTVQLTITIIGAVVGIIGLIAAVSRTFIEMVWKPKIEDLTAQMAKTESKNKELNAEVITLRQESEQRRLADSTAQEKKAAVDRRLQYTMTAIGATGASIFVPEPSKVSTNFVFLSVIGDAADKIRFTRFPMDKGIVGSVYANGKVLNTSNAHDDTRWSNLMDDIAKFHTQGLLCAPILLNGIAIGVVQFLNKADGQQFNSADEESVVQFTASIALTVDDFIHNYENFQRIGITPERDEKEAIVAFLDMTASKYMFSFLSASICVDRINEYLERQCEIAMKHGAVVDKYLGDGAMLRFMNSDIANAAKACVEMNRDFEIMKEGWCKFDSRMRNIFSRIGICCGMVREVNIGHPQFRQITVMGNIVNTASLLCECACKNRSIILADPSFSELKETSVKSVSYMESDITGMAKVVEITGSSE